MAVRDARLRVVFRLSSLFGIKIAMGLTQNTLHDKSLYEPSVPDVSYSSIVTKHTTDHDHQTGVH